MIKNILHFVKTLCIWAVPYALPLAVLVYFRSILYSLLLTGRDNRGKIRCEVIVSSNVFSNETFSMLENDVDVHKYTTKQGLIIHHLMLRR